MQKGKRWGIIHNAQLTIDNGQKGKTIETIISLLLENRGITTEKEKEEFLNPKLEDVTIESVGIDAAQLKKTIEKIRKAIAEKEQIIVYGDYDVDGITGTAILWETLHHLKANALPYIPHRVDEGYGLSKKGIENVCSKIPEIKLIITVDNGIVASEAVDFAKKHGIDVIITDHHTIGEKLPDAFSIVHTTKLCGASVGWMLAREIKKTNDTEHLDLVSLATVADLVPLTGKNRALLKNGLPYLQHTKRVGLRALCSEAGLEQEAIGVYEIGHIIGPRLNAMGRLESAMDSLRLLCTKNSDKAYMLAEMLGKTNKERQLLTQERSMHAIKKVKGIGGRGKSVLIVVDERYEEGIIGLVAGKLVEEFYRPSIVIAKGEKTSKASARSVAGFNIIEFIRTAQNHLINAGGHPMAAGFTVETEKITILQATLEALAEEQLTDEILTRILKIDCELPFGMINQTVYDSIQQLAPFGMGNAEPVFVSRRVLVEEVRLIGKEKRHLKLVLTNDERSIFIEAIAFGMAEKFGDLQQGQYIDIAYVIDENEWNGRKKLQIRVRDIQI